MARARSRTSGAPAGRPFEAVTRAMGSVTASAGLLGLLGAPPRPRPRCTATLVRSSGLATVTLGWPRVLTGVLATRTDTARRRDTTTVSICERRHKVAGIGGNEWHILGVSIADLLDIEDKSSAYRRLSTGSVHRVCPQAGAYSGTAGSQDR